MGIRLNIDPSDVNDSDYNLDSDITFADNPKSYYDLVTKECPSSNFMTCFMQLKTIIPSATNVERIAVANWWCNKTKNKIVRHYTLCVLQQKVK